MRLPKFLVGLLIGGLIGSLYWYWQKSTSAEDGALTVLDRLAASEASVRDLEARLRTASPPPVAADSRTYVSLADSPEKEEPASVDDLQQIEGIGPTYARRLEEAGVTSFADLAGMTAEQVMEISAARSAETAEAWIKAAQDHMDQ